MGFEPHSVARSALKPASRLLLRGPSPLAYSPRKGSTPFEIPCRGFKPTGTLQRIWSGRWDLNPRQLAWEARTLPLSYARSLRFVAHLQFRLLPPQGQVLLPC